MAKLGAPQPAVPYSSAAWSYGTVARLDTTGRGGFFLMIPVEEKPAITSQLTKAGIPAATAEDARIVRIESGRPRYGEEITERYLVQETGQLQAVNFGKGCYLGQEIVERVRSRAQIHRVLRQPGNRHQRASCRWNQAQIRRRGRGGNRQRRLSHRRSGKPSHWRMCVRSSPSRERKSRWTGSPE